MKTQFASLVILGLTGATFCFPQSARDYYKELYAAGGLDRMADRYVCFDDDKANNNFFIFNESKVIRETMIANGSFQKLSKSGQAEINKDFLIARGYNKGVPLASEDFYSKDGSSWISERWTFQNSHGEEGQVRFAIAWETLRYKRAVEILNREGVFQSEIARFGRCEEVSPVIPQHAH